MSASKLAPLTYACSELHAVHHRSGHTQAFMPAMHVHECYVVGHEEKAEIYITVEL